MQPAVISMLLLLTGEYWVHFLQMIFGSAFTFKESSFHVPRLLHNTNQATVPGGGDILKQQPQL